LARLLHEADVKFRTVFRSFDDTQVHCVDAGNESKPLMLLVHGSPGGWHHFSDYLMDPELVELAHMRAPDRLGYGATQPNEAEPSLARQAAAMAACIDGPPAVVVGHSYGGPVAVRLAADFPEKVSTLILIAPALDPDLEAIPLYVRIGKIPWLARWLLPAGVQASAAELQGFKGELHILQDVMSQVDCPVVLIHGERDRLVPYDNVRFARQYLEDIPVRTHRLVHADHYLPWTHFPLVQQVLLRMLKSGSPADDAGKNL
jgi:pimeloyl-ACP methyl ester carboxylesterase